MSTNETNRIIGFYEEIRKKGYNLEKIIEFLANLNSPEYIAETFRGMFYGISIVITSLKEDDDLPRAEWNEYFYILRDFILAIEHCYEENIIKPVNIPENDNDIIYPTIQYEKERSEIIQRMIDEKIKDIEFLKSLLEKRNQGINELESRYKR